MTINNNIHFKKFKKKCPNCELGSLEVRDILDDGKKLTYKLECSDCGFSKKDSYRCVCKKDELCVALIEEKSKDANHWLVATTEKCYTLKSSKAEMPCLKKLPIEFRPLVEQKITEFFQV